MCGYVRKSLDTEAEEGLGEKMTFEQRVGRSEWTMEIPGERALRQEGGKGKGQEATVAAEMSDYRGWEASAFTLNEKENL